MSHQAIYLGHRRQAIDFAQAARAATRQIATPRTVAMLAAMEACAHAAAGDARHSQHALDDAADALTMLSGQPEPEWLDFDEGGYWGHAARAYRDLGQAGRAEQYAARSVGLCQPAHARTRAQRTTIQATACLDMGEVDAAAAAAGQVVREAWNLHSGRVFGGVAQLADALRPFRTPVAKDFEDQAEELLEARGVTPGTTAGLAGHDDLERLSQPALRQPRSRGVLLDAPPQPLSEATRVFDLARMRPDRSHLAVERAGDIHIVVDLPLRAIDQRLHLWYPSSQQAEFVTFRVSEHMPWLGAGLPNIDSAGAGREQPLQLIVLFPVGGIHIDVQTQLAGLGLVSLAEDDRGLRATEADARRPDLYACFVAFQFDIAQYLAPEPRQQFGITCVQDQFGYATCHLITIASRGRGQCARLWHAG